MHHDWIVCALDPNGMRVVWNADFRGGLRTGEVLELHELYLGPHARVVMRMNVFYESLMDSKSVKDQVHDLH